MEDEKARALADVLGSKTCKKILDLLAESKELSEKEISQKLNAPINTIEYNLNKLLNAGLIEKAKRHFWSVKGKKVVLYTLSNKSIIIAPKSASRVSSKLKAILPAVILSGLGAVLVRQFFMLQATVRQSGADMVYTAAEKSLETAGESASAAQLASQSTILSSAVPQIWLWFLAGAIFALVILAVLNWRKF